MSVWGGGICGSHGRFVAGRVCFDALEQFSAISVGWSHAQLALIRISAMEKNSRCQVFFGMSDLTLPAPIEQVINVMISEPCMTSKPCITILLALVS